MGCDNRVVVGLFATGSSVATAAGRFGWRHASVRDPSHTKGLIDRRRIGGPNNGEHEGGRG